MQQFFAADEGQDARVVRLVTEAGFESWLEDLTPRARSAVAAERFTGKAGTRALLPGSEAEDWTVAAGLGEPQEVDAWALAPLPAKLPPGNYRLEGSVPGEAALGWALAQYRFDRYLNKEEANAEEEPRVLLLGAEEARQFARLADAQALVRDLVNTPAEDLGPAEMEAAVRKLAEEEGAKVSAIVGEDLLKQNFPAIHAVGRAAAPGREPRLIELEWGEAGAPLLAIIGKGVCFDSGGLDVKSASGMRLMKKDMGGAGHAIALAQLVMQARLPVRLKLLIPAVENSVSANALRPGDVIRTRAGLSVEIHNTDAEGRLILCDALALAASEEPDLILDFATLTGAARVALGPDLPALFTRQDELAELLEDAGEAAGDPVFRLPLWQGYMRMLSSDIADLANAATGSFAGAITAALYLSRFVDEGIDWAHFDTFAWTPAARPGRPKGGEALGLRASFGMLCKRYGER